jgi:uncharacterized protein (DUF2336 family)
LLDPLLHGLARRRRDLKLHRALGFVLHDDRARGHPLAVAHVPDLEADKVATAQLAVDAKIEERQLAHPV